MSKYGHRTGNWHEAIVNKMGGEDNADRFLRGESRLVLADSLKMVEVIDGTTIKVNLGVTPLLTQAGQDAVVEMNAGIDGRGVNCWVTVETKEDHIYIDGHPVCWHYASFVDTVRNVVPDEKTGYQLLYEVLAAPCIELVHPNVLNALVQLGRMPKLEGGLRFLFAPGVIFRVAHGARVVAGWRRFHEQWLPNHAPLHMSCFQSDSCRFAIIDTRDYSDLQ